MAGMIPKNTLEEIRARCDIVEVISAYVPLKRAGSNFKGLCPFHQEKTPSFVVNQERQVYRCFGCDESGDVFSFVMRRDNVDFITAARLLADRAGVPLEFTEQEKKNRVRKDTLFKLLDELCLFYTRILEKSGGAEGARRYLRERKLDNKQIVQSFRLGYAPNRRKTLEQWAGKHGYSLSHLEEGGMIGHSGDPSDPSSAYERFRNRLMFPIQDESGRVIGFSGRVLDASEMTAKYINSPETLLFKKSRVLYGLHAARQTMADQRRAIVCEGQIDVIRCQSAGLLNTVAPQGTALTEQHASLLNRYTDEVVLVFDADTAGQKAAVRSAEILLASGLSVQMASLPEGEDPDSLILKQGPEGFQRLLDTAKNVVDFKVDILETKLDLSSDAGILRTARSVLETIGHAQSAVQRDHLIQHAAKRLNLTVDALRKDLNRYSRKRFTSTLDTTAPPAELTPNRVPREEEEMIGLLLKHPDLTETIRRYITPEHFEDPSCRTLYGALLSREEGMDLQQALTGEDQACIRLAAKLEMDDRSLVQREVSAEKAAQDLILAVRRKDLERRRARIQSQLDSAEAKDRDGLQMECSEITQDMHALRQKWETARPILEMTASHPGKE